MPSNEYNAHNIGEIITNLTQKTVRSGRNKMKKLTETLKDVDTEKKYKERMLSLQ